MNEEIKKSSYSILFVDDEEMARKYFVKGLQNDFNVLVAQDVNEAKKVIEDNADNIAVVITDQRMPGDNGVVLLEHLRINYPHIIRLLTTAYSDLDDAINSVNKGEIFRYIQKPWDYKLLKTELNQALDLFETRIERDQLLHEKMSVKKRMSKIDRVKSLVLLARTLKMIRFTDSSIEHFVRQFAIKPHQEISEDWQSFELGNSDLLETLFLVDIVDRVHNKITVANDYDFSHNVDSQKIVELIQNASDDNKVKSVINSKQIKDVKINDYALGTAIKVLFLEISSLLKDSTNDSAEVNIEENQNGNGVNININISKIDWPEASNMFIIPSNKKADLYVNLLICYLLIGHHGGSFDVQYNDQQSVHFQINLPYQPDQVDSSEGLSEESLDDMILLSMLDGE